MFGKRCAPTRGNRWRGCLSSYLCRIAACIACASVWMYIRIPPIYNMSVVCTHVSSLTSSLAGFLSCYLDKSSRIVEHVCIIHMYNMLANGSNWKRPAVVGCCLFLQSPQHAQNVSFDESSRREQRAISSVTWHRASLARKSTNVAQIHVK